MIEVVIQGIYGRMGTELAQMIAQRGDCKLAAGIDQVSGPALAFPVFSAVEDVAGLAHKPDVLIDFSLPEAAVKALDYGAKNDLPCVICTTGLDKDAEAKMHEAAKSTAVFYSANMSLGVNLLRELITRAQKILQGFDIEIIEKHHHHKLDAPSGTALMLANTLNENAGGTLEYVYDRHSVRQERKPNEIGIHAVRGGSFVGEHEVLFAGPDEVLSVTHTAYSRNVFANGAVAAALFLAGKAPGMYSMKDLMEEA